MLGKKVSAIWQDAKKVSFISGWNQIEPSDILTHFLQLLYENASAAALLDSLPLSIPLLFLPAAFQTDKWEGVRLNEVFSNDPTSTPANQLP